MIKGTQDHRVIRESLGRRVKRETQDQRGIKESLGRRETLERRVKKETQELPRCQARENNNERGVRDCAEARPGDDHGDARMRLTVRCPGPIVPLPSWTARNRKPYGKAFVAAPGVNVKMVNRSAPDLFPAIGLVKKSFIRREMRRLAPLFGREQSALSY